MNGRRLTISMGLSFSRIVLVVPFWWCVVSGGANGRWWALLILAVGVATDFLDGYLARRLHQVTELGKIIDPLADKFAVAAMALLLVLNREIPVWYFVTVVVRDALIVLGGLYIRRTKNIIAQSNWPGKIAVNVIAAYLLLSLVKMPSLQRLRVVTLWLSIGFMLYSMVVYAQRLFIGPKTVKDIR